jgi:hypothetical protein
MLEDLDCPWDIFRVNRGAHAVNSDNLKVLDHIAQMATRLFEFLCFHIISWKSAIRFRPTLYITPAINTALLVKRQVRVKFVTSVTCHVCLS